MSKFEGKDNTLVCILRGEWGTMCRARNLVVGQKIMLVVAHQSNNNVIYLRPVPGEYKERHIVSPMTAVISKKTVEVLNYIRG